MNNFNLFFVVVTVCVISCCFWAQCVAEETRKIPDVTAEHRPFRMQKVNLFWEKAKKRLSGMKLADLYADLLVHDKHEANFKKIRSEGMDKDGLKEAQLNLQFREIVEKYGLDDFYDLKGQHHNDLPEEKEKEKRVFTDKKLKSMWQRAEAAGFTARDLEKLREEFWHQQMKIDEMNMMKNELGIEDISDNEIELSKKTGKSVEQLKASKKDLKKQHKNVKAGYYELEGRFDELETEEQDFEDARVHQLWAMARKTDWSPEELQSFKKELRHFENRLQKHEYLEDQLERSAESLKDQDDEGNYIKKHEQLEQKTNDIALKVKKLHADLKKRVGKAMQHVEL